MIFFDFRASQDSTKSRESPTPKKETSISKTLNKEIHDLSVKRHEQKCLKKDGVMRYSRKQMYKVMKLYSKEVNTINASIQYAGKIWTEIRVFYENSTVKRK